MLQQKLYFLIALYFQLWAKIVLARWKPVIIAITGSAGKTTTLELIESVISQKYSVKATHKANAVTAIPLHILGLQQTSFSVAEWLKLALIAPIRSLTCYPKENFYLCELDSDRWQEMDMHTRLIHPDITCWTNAYPTHTQNFPGENQIEVTRNMAYDFGFALERNKKLSFINGDNTLMLGELKRSPHQKGLVTLEKQPNSLVWIASHTLNLNGTHVTFSISQEKFSKLYSTFQSTTEVPFKTDTITLHFPLTILSLANMYGLAMAVIIGMLYGISNQKMQDVYKRWKLPPGRMSLFSGIKATTIIDSSYNASRVAMIDAIEVLKEIGNQKTIAVIGDMRELGTLSQTEHELVAKALVDNSIRKIVLVGPHMQTYVLPFILQHGYELNKTVFHTNSPQDVVSIIKSQGFLNGGETILVKGSQNTLFLEGVVQQLLVSKKDVEALCRRETRWNSKRQAIYPNL